jgi:L-lactate dehydrogenase
MDDADVMVITSSRSVGTSDRMSELEGNVAVFRELVPEVARRAPRAIFIVVSNPVDAMTHLTIRLGGIEPSRVIGTGTLLDTVRFRALLAEAWKINPMDVRAYIMGEHGESQFPALSIATAGGVRIHEHDDLVRRAADATRNAGRDIVQSKGFTNFGVASSVAMIVEAIASDAYSVMPVSTLIDGYLGVRDVCLSVPSVIARQGVVRTLPVDLNDEEADAFRRSAEVLRKAIDSVDR